MTAFVDLPLDTNVEIFLFGDAFCCTKIRSSDGMALVRRPISQVVPVFLSLLANFCSRPFHSLNYYFCLSLYLPSPVAVPVTLRLSQTTKFPGHGNCLTKETCAIHVKNPNRANDRAIHSCTELDNSTSV